MAATGRSFTLRWVVGLALALGIVGALGYRWERDRLEARLAAEAVAMQQADAAAVTRAATRTLRDDRELTSVSPILRALGDRPEILSIELISSQGWVKAASLNTMVNKWRHDPALTRALVTRRTVMTGGPGRSRDGRFKTLTPISLPSGRFVLLVERRDRRSELLVAELRDGMLLLGLGAFAGVMALFWLTAGRALSAQHRAAVRSSLRDGLTGLGNHRAFQEELARAAAISGRRGDDVALVVIDLDDFKSANDQHGHKHGDELLRRVADVLASGRMEERAFRTGGDEFAVIMPRSTEVEALEAVRRILVRLHGEARATCSVGVSASRRRSADAALLRAEADAALYEAKRRGKNRPVAFSEVRDHVALLTPDKTAAVEAVIAHGAVDVAVQPIWDMAEDRLVGVEALARPRCSDAIAGPAEAFDVADQLGCTIELDQVCARAALARLPEVPAGARLFVNLAPQTLAALGDGDTWLLEATRAAGGEPGQVVVEISERLGGRRSAVVRGAAALAAQGFVLALDDVGTGNAGLEMLAAIDVSYVKVDRSIILAAVAEHRARAVLQAIIAFAQGTGAFVIAEGVEDEGMLDFLAGLDELSREQRMCVRGGQGYALGRPDVDLERALMAGRLALARS